MKCLMCVFAAAMAFAAVADGPAAAPKGVGQRQTPSIEPIVQMVRNPKAVEKLGFSAEQVAKLKEIGNSREALKELQTKVRKGSERQVELLKAEKVDEAAVLAVVDEVWSAKKEIAKIQTKRLIAVRSVLSAEEIRRALEVFRLMHAKRGAKGCPAEKPAKTEP